MDILNMRVSDMPGISYQCDCGKRHSVEIRRIEAGRGVLQHIADCLKPFQERQILIVCDENTFRIAGEQVQALLQTAGYRTELLILSTEGYPVLIPDERAVGSVQIHAGDDTGLILGVGSGTINDLCKIVSYKMKLPSVIVGTAPSMDGYASTMSPLIIDRHKITYPSHYPDMIIADSDIMKDAPDDMLRAGFGDIVGKYTALSDWRLTVAVNGEFYCETTAALVKNAVDLCVQNVERFMRRDPEAVTVMTEALLLSGIAMGLVGITRPASGSEHHLAHYWELDAIEKGKAHPLHGNSVGLASIASAEAYAVMSERFETVARVQAPDPDMLRTLYAKAGSALHPAQLGISRDVFKESLNNGYRIRPRYTIFNFTKDHGMLPEIAAIVTERMFRD